MKQEKVPVQRNEVPAMEASVVLFSLETLIITVSAGAVAALVVGYLTGEFSLEVMTRSIISNI